MDKWSLFFPARRWVNYLGVEEEEEEWGWSEASHQLCGILDDVGKVKRSNIVCISYMKWNSERSLTHAFKTLYKSGTDGGGNTESHFKK